MDFPVPHSKYSIPDESDYRNQNFTYLKINSRTCISNVIVQLKELLIIYAYNAMIKEKERVILKMK